MLLLQKDGYGVEQGIPTLLMAAGSFDDILAITGFTTCLGVAFATGILSLRVIVFIAEPRHGFSTGRVHVGSRLFRARFMVRCLRCWLKAPPGTTC